MTAKNLDNNYVFPIEDKGATLKSVFQALEQYNYIDEVKYPYILENINKIPPQPIFEESLKINKCPIVNHKQILQNQYQNHPLNVLYTKCNGLYCAVLCCIVTFSS